MRLRKLLAAALVLSTLAGCSKIDYTADIEGENSSAEQTTTTVQAAPPANILTENLPVEYKINNIAFKRNFEAESMQTDEPLTEINGYSGEGYIELKPYRFLSFELDVVASQHYNIEIYACGKGGAVTLTVGGTGYIDSENGKYKILDGETHGTYKVAESMHFLSYSVAPAYIENGKKKITLQAVNGSVYIDKITVSNTDVKDTARYNASSSLSGDGLDYSRIALMNYLNSIYGEKTILAQYCTPGTNAEIDAIYKHTGRYPAIRFSDLAYYTETGYTMGDKPTDDISLAADWGKHGGIVGYSWYWYSPIGKATLYSKDVDFGIQQIYSDVNSVATLTEEELKILLDEESITEECYEILTDMDAIAKQLKILNENDIPVLFKPLATSDGKLYWWERDEEIYKWLWKTMHQRFQVLHGLDNLIWVCPVKSPRMYPGDDYADIVGCDIYNNSNVSNLAGMITADSLTLNTKMMALTECCFTPDPDILYRDNAMWLWTAPWCGKYLINENGDMTGNYISIEQLRKIYSHQLTVARDELEIE